MTFKKAKRHKTLWDIVNTLGGMKKHYTIEEILYDVNKTELPTEEWTAHITVGGFFGFFCGGVSLPEE